MKILSLLKASSMLVTILTTCNLHASDVDKEKRWADQIIDTLMVGDAEWLTAEKHKFLGIYTESENDKPAGAVIVLHGIGVHPNWEDVVQPLRSELPESGWHTIAVQMPVLRNEAKTEDYIPLFPEVAPRLDATIAFLKGKGVRNIIIAAHSLGASMAAYFMAGKPDPAVKAMIVVGVSGRLAPGANVNFLQSLQTIQIPVLDIYGSEDLKAVLDTASKRASTAEKAGNKHYQQTMVPDADHFFKGKSDILVKQVVNWIKQYRQ